MADRPGCNKSTQQHDHEEEVLDEALDETFPASDTPSVSPGADKKRPADEDPPQQDKAP